MSESYPPIDCDTAQTFAQKFASGSLLPGERSRLRQHQAGCQPCAELFLAMGETLARLGKQKRESRVVREKALRSYALRRDVFEAAESSRGWRARLRTLVYPAFFGFLMLLLTHRIGERPGMAVQAMGPEVWLRGARVQPQMEGARVLPGERLAVGTAGKALLSGEGSEWSLSHGTEVRLEGLAPASMRLLAGTARVSGPFRCYGPGTVALGEKGVVATLEVRDGAMHVTPVKGVVQILSPDGATELQPRD